MAKFTCDPVTISGNIRTDSSTQEMDLGVRVNTNDGRSFRYVLAGATALVAGKLYDAPATVTNHVNIAVASAAAAGATQVTVTLGATAVTAGDYDRGYLMINDAAGEGFTYTIDSTPAADASASLTVTLDPDEPIITALTTSSEASLIPNQYRKVVIHATTEASVPVGAANTQVTAAQYGFLQTRGPIALLDNSGTGIGLSVAASDTTNAGGSEVGDGILPVIGYQISAGVSTEYRAVFLTID